MNPKIINVDRICMSWGMYLLVPPLSFNYKKPAYEIIAPSLPKAEAIP